MKLLVFHFEISGNSVKPEHSLNKKDASVTLDTSHSPIPGIDVKLWHFENIALISFTLLVFHFERSGNSFKLTQHPKVEFISVT